MAGKQGISGTEPAWDGAGVALPERVDVVVIGGGVAGVAAALTLAEWGVPVLLCEKGRIAAEQSSRNWGWIRKQGRDPRELPLMLEAQTLWRRHAQALDTDIGFRQAGCTYLCADQDELAQRESWLDHARAFQIGSRMLSRKEMQDLLGDGATRFRGALYTPDDAQAEPGLAVPALARRAAALGAHIRENTAVRSIRRTGGRVSGVVTEHGTVSCETVILAGGVLVAPLHGKPGPLPAPARDPLFCAAHRANAGNRPRRHRRHRRLDPPAGGWRPIRSGARGAGPVRDQSPAAFRHLFAFLPVLRKRWRIVDLPRQILLRPARASPLGR